jgi:hypothetical protein
MVENLGKKIEDQVIYPMIGKSTGKPAGSNLRTVREGPLMAEFYFKNAVPYNQPVHPGSKDHTPDQALHLTIGWSRLTGTKHHLNAFYHHVSTFIFHVSVFKEYAAVFIEYAAILSEYAAVFKEYAAILSEYAAVFKEYAAILSEYAAVFEEYTAKIVPACRRFLFFLTFLGIPSIIIYGRKKVSRSFHPVGLLYT